MNKPRNLTYRPLAVALVLGMSTLATAQTVSIGIGTQPRWGRPNTPREGACFYRDPNFRGSYFCARVGEDIAIMGRQMNDQISSIRTFGDTEVTIFQDPRFRGRWTRLEDDVRNLRREGWNDSLSSVRINRGWGRDRGAYRDRGNRSGIGRIETGEWRDDRGDRGDRRDGSGGRNDSTDRRDNSGVGRNDSADRRDSNNNTGRRSSENADVIVRRVYQEVLQRDVDPAGLTLYRDRMNNENWSEQDVKEALLKSPEYRQRASATPQKKAEDIVARAYRSTLNREPDPASQVYVQKVLREGWSEADVVRELRNSPEYRSKH